MILAVVPRRDVVAGAWSPPTAYRRAMATGAGSVDPGVLAAIRAAALEEPPASARARRASGSRRSGPSTSRCATARSRPPSTTPRSAWASAWSRRVDRASPRRSSSAPTPRRGSPARRSTRRGVAAPGAQPARSSSPRAGARRGRVVLALPRSTRRRCRWPRRSALLDGVEPAAARGAGRRPRDRARAGGRPRTSTTPTSPGTVATPAPRARIHPAARGGRARRRRRLRDDADPRPAGRARLGVPRGRGLGLGRRARRAARAARREARLRRRSRPGATTSSSTRPTSGSRSTSRSATPPSSTGRSATRPPTPAPRSPPSTSSARSATGRAVMHVTGDRTDAARPRHRRLSTTRAWRPSPSTSSATASSSATSSTAAIAAVSGLGPVQRLRVRRLAAARPDPADGQRLARSPRPPRGPTTEELIGGVDRGIYIVGDKSWSIDMQRYNFQFTGQRFFRIEDGRLAGQLRDVAYQATTTEFWGSLEAVGGAVDLPPRRRVQLRQGPARPGGAGEPRRALGAVARRRVLNARAGVRAMSARRGLAAGPRGRRARRSPRAAATAASSSSRSRSEAERAVREQHHDHQRRAPRPRRDGRQRRRRSKAASPRRSASPRRGDVDVAELVGRGEAGGRRPRLAADDAAPADRPGADRRRLRRPRPPRRTSSVLATVARRAARRLRPRRRGPGRCWRGSPSTGVATDVPRDLDRLRRRHVQPTGALQLVARSADGAPLGLGRASATARLLRRRRSSGSRSASRGGSSWAARTGRAARGPLRGGPAARRGRRPHGRPLGLRGRGPGRRGRPDRLLGPGGGTQRRRAR